MLGLRILFLIVGLVIGGFLGHLGASGVHDTLRLKSVLQGCFFGLIVSIVVVALEVKLRRMDLKTMLGATLGMFFALVMANLVTFSLASLALTPSTGNKMLVLLVNLSAAYLGAAIGARVVQELDLAVLSRILKGSSKYGTLPKVLDTSAIIDGRIADVCETGFIEGSILIPAFVLKELHQIADSSESVKSIRGKRGMEIVQRLKGNGDIDLQIVEEDFINIAEVDLKLVALCRKVSGRLVTNDMNLNKTAELQGVGVINMNQLATSTKPVILTGEEMNRMKVIKEGKEPSQGVAYLDDGTMVVIDNARNKIGQEVDVKVTSVLQTPTGRMIFAKIDPENRVPASRS